MNQNAILISFLCFLNGAFLHAQSGSVVGRVTQQGEGVPGITVSIKGTTNATFSDHNGDFVLNDIAYGNHTLICTGIGFEHTEYLVTLTRAQVTVSIKLHESTTELEAVQVVGKSEWTELREKPFSVAIIDVKPLKVQNLDVNQVLGTVSGVRIREEGGLGSGFNFSLNGFSGEQVKFFIDGVPMDNFGTSLSLNNIPVNMISGIEVYKGVVPVHLGSDALGGAINVTTNQNIKNYLNASYAIGSFNTHRGTVLGRWTEKNTGFAVNANFFFNYSDNNYTMYGVEAPRQDGSGKPDTVDVERFHDAYQSQTAQVEIGITDKPFADRLFIGLIASSNENEVQTGYNLQQVYGEVTTSDEVLIPTFKYKKSDLFIEGLDLNAYAMYNRRKAVTIDTSSRKYDWYGNYFIRTNNAGEYSYNKSHFKFDDHSYLSTANLSHTFSDKHSLSFNNMHSWFRRVGSDSMRDYNEVPFTKPNIISKDVTALAYNLKLFEGKWRTTVFGKHFTMNSNTQIENEETDTYEAFERSFSLNGYGLATTYYVFDWVQLKLSYENTNRLPEGEEMFGNGLLVKPSLDLEPEQSNNYNAGLLVNKIFRNHTLLAEANFLYRNVEDLIRQQPSGQSAVYINQNKVNLTSYEVALKYNYKRLLNLSVSITKQKNINADKEDRLYGDDLPNQPFFFGNMSAGLQIHDVGPKGSKLTINWFTLFVDKFYWKWPSQGSTKDKYDIPTQLSHDLTISYSLANGRYNAAFACTNLTNALRYDNFALQKPGRAFSMKLSYYISK